MGFKRKTYRLAFEDSALEGLEVRTRGAAIGHVVEYASLHADPGQMVARTEEGEAIRRRLYELLADRIIDWNRVDDDDQPIPCTVETLREEDWRLILAVGKAWMRSANEVDDPLEPGSPSGGPSLEASIPMDVPSESLTS